MSEKFTPVLLPPPSFGNVPLPNGCTLYWKETVVGGREYFSDEIGGGCHVWDTALIDQSTLLAAIVQEQTFQKLEQVIKERLNKRNDELDIEFDNLLLPNSP